MTAPDPRLGEIEAAEALVHVKCADCGKCRTAEEDCWCPECEYWGCEQGSDCEDDSKPTDVAYLLAELRKRDEALAAALKLAEEWRYKGEHGWGAWQEGHGPDQEGYILDGASADLRAAISDALTPDPTEDPEGRALVKAIHDRKAANG